MENIQALVNKAQNLKDSGKYQEALMCYSDTMDLLVEEANEYARNQEGTQVDIGSLRSITPRFFDESRKFLKQDMTAAIISNNMGSLYARLGDKENAEKMFKDAIDLTTEGQEYTDPKTGLKEISL